MNNWSVLEAVRPVNERLGVWLVYGAIPSECRKS